MVISDYNKHFAASSVNELRFQLMNLFVENQIVFSLYMTLLLLSWIGILVYLTNKKTIREVKQDIFHNPEQGTTELRNDSSHCENSGSDGNTYSPTERLGDARLSDLVPNNEISWLEVPYQNGSEKLGSLEPGPCLRRSPRLRNKPKWVSDVTCYGCPTQCRI